MQGFLLNIGKKELFYKTDINRKNPSIIKNIIKGFCNYRGFDPDTTNKMINSSALYKDVSYSIAYVTLEKKYNSGIGDYYNISSKYFGGAYDLDEIIIIN